MYANAAFLAANTANVNSVSASSYANSAYTQANTGTILAQASFDLANSLSGGTSTDGFARNSANAASSYANSAYLQANTANTTATSSGVYANAAFVAANASINFITLGTANSAASYANGAFVQANTAATNAAQSDQRAVTSGAYANSAYIHANAAFAIANSGGGGTTDTFARNQANASYIHANAAFAVANSGGGGTTDTFARIQANAAFDAANAASGGAFNLSVALDSFVADGNTTTFTLSTTPTNENYTLITLNGVTQHKSAYTLTGNVITFSEAPSTSLPIDVVTYYGVPDSAGSYANSAFQTANSAGAYANAAFAAANNATDTWVRNAANAASSYANSSFIQANTAQLVPTCPEGWPTAESSSPVTNSRLMPSITIARSKAATPAFIPSNSSTCRLFRRPAYAVSRCLRPTIRSRFIGKTPTVDPGPSSIR